MQFFILANTYLSIAILYRGTACGWAEFTITQPILCNGTDPRHACPPGYTQDFRHVCYKSDSKMEDLPRTFCGIISDGVGPTCDGLPVGKCPDKYLAINYDTMNWHACAKE